MDQIVPYQCWLKMEEHGMNSILKSFDSQESLIENFSQEIIEKLELAIKERDNAILLVSGGSTPKYLFNKLSNIDFPWEKVKIGLVDERWIPENNNDSNAKLVKKLLLKNKASKASFVSLYQPNKEAKKAEDFCSELVKQEYFPCDVIILGMGNDAHTASLFPHKEELKYGLDIAYGNYCISMMPNDANHMRMSLTLSAILKAKNIYLHIEGKNKKYIYNKAIVESNYKKSPISAVLRNNIKKVKVYYNE